MEWTEEGIVVGVRRYGETSVILEVMTRDRGRHLGLVRGGRSRRLRPVVQPGNTLSVTWRARLDEHLGAFRVEPVAERAAQIMNSAAGSFALQLLGDHVRLLPERDPHPRLFDALAAILDNLDDALLSGELVARFELMLLDELGVGLDLACCAATGVRDDLGFVSPKSGRAVSRQAGQPYGDRLLRLPAFLIAPSNSRVALTAIGEAFSLTGFFLERHVYGPRGTCAPDVRASFLRALPAQAPCSSVWDGG